MIMENDEEKDDTEKEVEKALKSKAVEIRPDTAKGLKKIKEKIEKKGKANGRTVA